jgi:hypothetical protein
MGSERIDLAAISAFEDDGPSESLHAPLANDVIAMKSTNALTLGDR